MLERVSASRRMPKDTPRGQLGHPQAHSAAQQGGKGSVSAAVNTRSVGVPIFLLSGHPAGGRTVSLAG